MLRKVNVEGKTNAVFARWSGICMKLLTRQELSGHQVALCCSVLQCVAVCCSVLQCVARAQ